MERAKIILLHGLHSDGAFFAQLSQRLERLGTDALCIDAPQRQMSVFKGRTMAAWCDIVSLDFNGAIDVEGSLATFRRLDAVIAGELAKGTPARRIFIGGFSQGGYIALSYLISTTIALGGGFAFSTFMPEAAWTAFYSGRARADIPVLLGHGADDFIIPRHYAAATAAALRRFGFVVQEAIDIKMEHEMTEDADRVVLAWLQKLL